MDFNKIEKFNQETMEKLKWYVYMYTDPTSNKVFYIGKGKENRCFEHLDDPKESDKVKTIAKIIKRGDEPLIELLCHGLTEDRAFQIEACCIDLIGVENLDNKVKGWHAKRELVRDITIKYTAENAVLEHDVILFHLSQVFHSKMSRDELYEATRGTWGLNDHGRDVEKYKYALAVNKGIVREVYEIKKWQKSGTINYKFRNLSEENFVNKSGKCKWEFVGNLAEGKIRNHYKMKKIRHLLSKKNQSPFNYLNC